MPPTVRAIGPTPRACLIGASIRREADTWGHHARRFAALAEVVVVSGGPVADACDLLDRAATLPFGYAGYQAPASLTLADANLVCRPAATEPVSRALESARRAAHNVQEARFCALTTARTNAIALRWQPGTIRDLAAAVERFAADPLAAEFAPVHRVGECYAARAGGANVLAIPERSLTARSLAEIARDVYGLPLVRFERLNPGVEPNRPLADDSSVNVLDQSSPRIRTEKDAATSDGTVSVSDSGFVPMLAARFAAEVLARRSELGNRAADLIAQLVPCAAPSTTSLDLVLARLLLAVRPDDPTLVARVRAGAPDEWMRSPVPNRNVEA